MTEFIQKKPLFIGYIQIHLNFSCQTPETADERIVNGTAAITDLGMCGPYTSVIGRDVDEIIKRFTTNEKTKFTVAGGPGIFCGAVVCIDDVTNQATKIERIQIRPTNEF